MKRLLWLSVFPVFFLFSCSLIRQTAHQPASATTGKRVVAAGNAVSNPGYAPLTRYSRYSESVVRLRKTEPRVEINTRNVRPDELLRYARMQLGIPYVYGSMDRKKGFDCSGFISYVFGHFKIDVPRMTYLFTNTGVDIPIEFSRPGDIILFTGSDAGSGVVGHMGIVTKNDHGRVEFIHASSSRGVMISDMNSYFIPRYVRVNRIFIPKSPDNG